MFPRPIKANLGQSQSPGAAAMGCSVEHPGIDVDSQAVDGDRRQSSPCGTPVSAPLSSYEDAEVCRDVYISCIPVHRDIGNRLVAEAARGWFTAGKR